ncbi:hypothetical protein ABS71_19270 [bacterium SCN 62-11]|nr:hypothetical protein [Candidatus Eremiobacteraeota bacterium]ODT57865.1 MAG: hypothetical protein ABS71_19270 [bacterium SCN 62-11]
MDIILPRIARKGTFDPEQVFYQPLVGELFVTFAVGQQPALGAAGLQQLGLNAVTVMARSLDNLSAQLTKMSGQPVSGLKFGLETDRTVFTSLKVGNGLEACLLLLPHVWNQLSEQVMGDLVVGVPGRDRILYTGTDDFEGQLAMRKVLEAAFEDAGPQALSKELFVWRKGSWQAY